MAVPRDEEALRVLQDAELIHDAATVQATYGTLAEAVTERVAGDNPIIMPVMMGGLFAAAGILPQLHFPFQLDYLQVSRYRGAVRGGELLWKVSPTISLTDRVVVVIDDIVDEGHTLRALEDALMAQSPAHLLVVTLLEKETDRRVDNVKVDLVGLQVPDRYVFGCGMDYKGYWRQLPAIYALAGSG